MTNRILCRENKIIKQREKCNHETTSYGCILCVHFMADRDH